MRVFWGSRRKGYVLRRRGLRVPWTAWQRASTHHMIVAARVSSALPLTDPRSSRLGLLICTPAACRPRTSTAPLHVLPRPRIPRPPPQALPADAPVLVLLPGLTGGSGDSYVSHAVLSARAAGMRAVVFNSRGTADSPVITPQFYSASFTGDTR